MTQINDLDHLINELSVADQVLKTVDKAQKPDPVVEKIVVETLILQVLMNFGEHHLIL